MIIQRQFSIQSGSPDKGGSLSRELKSRAVRGAAIGAVTGLPWSVAGGALTGSVKVGAGIAAGSMIAGSIADALQSIWATGRRESAENQNMSEVIDELSVVYGKCAIFDEDGDLKRVDTSRYIVTDKDPSKFMVSCAFKDGSLVLNLMKPTGKLIEGLNEDLECMIKYNRKADYASTETKDGYLVSIVCPDLTWAAAILYSLISKNRIKINCLTSETLNKQKSFSSIRKVKKAAGNIAMGIVKDDRKLLGQVEARMEREGLRKGILKTANTVGTEKVAKSALSKMEKLTGQKATPEDKKAFIDNFKKARVETAKLRR